MRFPAIPVDRQLSIAQVLDQSERTVQSAQARAESLDGFRRALLPALLSGAHTIPTSYDELLPHAGALEPLEAVAV